MKSRTFWILILFISPTVSFTQDTISYQIDFSPAQYEMKLREDTLVVLGYAVVNDSTSLYRFNACRSLIKGLVRALKTPDSFDYPFSRLKTVSIQYPPDSSFRVFTWQLYVDKDTYHYYGAIQMNTEDLQLFPLVDRIQKLDSLEHQIVSPQTWPGALYYQIKEFTFDGQPYYLLFGFNALSFFEKRKMVDVLHFDNGQAVFGGPVFYEIDEKGEISHVKNRLVFDYSAEAAVVVHYDLDQQMVVYDHLMDIGSRHPGQKPSKIPTGSLDGYAYRNGRWEYVQEVFRQTQDEPLFEEKPLETDETREKKDIFGRPMKKRKRTSDS